MAFSASEINMKQALWLLLIISLSPLAVSHAASTPQARLDHLWLRAHEGQAQAQDALGAMYFFGFGVPQNDAKAYKWYRLAAEKGNAEAQNNLGTMYFEGQGAPKNYAKALKWWHLAAERGFAPAQDELGLLYYRGQGVLQNYVTADKWWHLAAEKGDASAQFSLGAMYATGHGVLKNEAKAYKWYRRAAEQGDAKAQLALGAMYYLAAERGDALAQSNLGRLYYEDMSVPQNYVAAYKWFLLSQADMSPTDPSYSALAGFMRAVRTRMMPSEIILAQQEAAAWEAAHPYAGPPH